MCVLSLAGVQEARVRQGERSDGASLLVAANAREAPQEDRVAAARRGQKSRGRYQGEKRRQQRQKEQETNLPSQLTHGM